MSYRRDADVFSPYGLVQKRAKIPQKNYTSIFWKKSKDVAWISSNCGVPSKRDEYVKEMSKYIPVDIEFVFFIHIGSIKRSLKRSKNPFLVISLPGRIRLHHILMKNNSITSIE
jgi:hypothetical protein